MPKLTPKEKEQFIRKGFYTLELAHGRMSKEDKDFRVDLVLALDPSREVWAKAVNILIFERKFKGAALPAEIKAAIEQATAALTPEYRKQDPDQEPLPPEDQVIVDQAWAEWNALPAAEQDEIMLSTQVIYTLARRKWVEKEEMYNALHRSGME